MLRSLAAAFSIAIGLSGMCQAQGNAPVTPAAPAAPEAAVQDGIQSQNIFTVKPDASSEPGYDKQSNAERAKVQPGNNAPMWRQVGAGVTGTSSLPKSEAPEAGNLIQPFVQYQIGRAHV